MPVNAYPIHPTLLAAALALACQSAALGQISLTGGSYTEDFDTVLAAGADTMPAGWSVVSNGNSFGTLHNSDGNWAGSARAYNGALQTDITQPGDSLADRGLSLYSTGQNENRYITASFLNDTGGKIIALAVSFDVALYASFSDSVTASGSKTWDGFFLRLDPGSGLGSTNRKFLRARITLND